MGKAARNGDAGDGHGCFPPTTITGGSPDIIINGRPAARQGDPLAAHGCGDCSPHGRVIAEGSSTVIFNGKPAARTGDAIDCGGVIIGGSGDVIIGDTPYTSPDQPCLEAAKQAGAVLVQTYPQKPKPVPKAPPKDWGLINRLSGLQQSEQPLVAIAEQALTRRSSVPYTGAASLMGTAQHNDPQAPVINTKILPDTPLRDMLNDNREEILLVTPEEAFRIHEWAKQHWSDNYDKEAYKFTFDTLKGYGVHAADAYHIATLIRAFNGVGLRSYTKVVEGKTYIIFKGYAGIRQILTGTRYLANNAKIIQLGLGQKGINNVVKSGAVLSIFVISGMRAADYLLRDKATMAELIGGIGVDVAKLGVSTAAAWTAGTVTGVVFSGFTLGPLIAVVVVGVLVSLKLDAEDKHYKIEDKVVEFLEKSQQEVAELARIIEETDPEEVFWDMAAAYLDDMLEHGKTVIESEVKRYIKRKLAELPFYRLL